MLAAWRSSRPSILRSLEPDAAMGDEPGVASVASQAMRSARTTRPSVACAVSKMTRLIEALLSELLAPSGGLSSSKCDSREAARSMVGTEKSRNRPSATA